MRMCELPRACARCGAFFLTLLAVLSRPTDAGAQEPARGEVDEIVARVADHWGGADRLAAMKGLSVRVTYTGHDYPVTVDVARPGRVRVRGGDRYVSVFDGDHAAFLLNHDREGKRLEPRLVPDEETQDWELEAAWIFPAFFDHPATYEGRVALGADSALVLRVILPLGATVDYFVDPEAFTVRRAEATSVIDGTVYRRGRTYRDFARMDGVEYPTHMDVFFGEGTPEPATIEALSTAATFPPEHFGIPASLLDRGTAPAAPGTTSAELQARAAATLTWAAEAHGGWDRLRAVRTVTYDADMERGYLGQNPTPDDETVGLSPARYRVTWDLGRGGAVAEIFQPVDAPRPAARTVLEPGGSFLSVPSRGVVQDLPPMDGPPWSWFVRDAVFAPALLLDAADAAASLRPAADDGDGPPGITFVDGQGRVVTLWLDPATGLLERREVVIDHPQWGRTVETTAFGDYVVLGGLQAPQRVTVSVGDQVLSRGRFGAPRVNQDGVEALFERPAGARAVPSQMPTGASAARRTEELAPGVFQVMNVVPGYNLAYVVFDDRIVLIEPLGGREALEAVLAEIRSTFPDRPIATAVVTHHHFDHTDGLLPLLAAGTTIYAPAGMEAFVRRMASAPRVDPRAARLPSVRYRPVTEPVTVGEGPDRFTLVDVGANPHAAHILVAYFPEHRLLYVPDVYGYLPGYTPAPLLLAFADELSALGLEVERFATAHTAPTTFSEYEAMVAAARAQGSPGR